MLALETVQYLFAVAGMPCWRLQSGFALGRIGISDNQALSVQDCKLKVNMLLRK